MQCAFNLKADIPLDTIARFMDAATEFRDTMGRSNRATLRSSTIDFIKSVRKITRTSKKFVDRKDIRKGVSVPKVYTGSKTGKTYRRMVVKRWRKGQQFNKIEWVEAQMKYTTRMGMRNGNYQGIVKKVDDNTKLVNLTREKKGKIGRYGLAKKSWGWFMQSLFKMSVGTDENEGAKIKPSMVEASHNTEYHTTSRGKSVLTAESYSLTNKLKYIRKALKPGGLIEAMNQATKSIKYKMENKLKSTKFAN